MPVVSIKRVSELIREVEDGTLVLRPFFQRRLVWTKVVKDRFLETVRLGLPFPEIFVATGVIDTTTMVRTNWLVDGQQRISTLRQYAQGSDDLDLKLVKPYAQLSDEEKTQFLNYEVVVRDLGTVTEQQIRDIFHRINSTDYALKAMERLNALFSGEYIHFCQKLAEHSFFQKHDVFSLADWRRMRDVDFCVILVTTVLSTYYNRDELNREYLRRFNDDFPNGERVEAEIGRVFSFLEECAFGPKSRAWKKTDLFTLLVELHSALVIQGLTLRPVHVGGKLSEFYARVDDLYSTKAEITKGKDQGPIFRYLKAATKATNDKYARVDRGEIIADLIASTVQKANRRPSEKTKKDRASK